MDRRKRDVQGLKERKPKNERRSLKMKGLVIFDTSYGNTRKIAETISETLTESGIGVETIYVKKVRKLSAKQYDFLVLGSPTRFGTMSFTFKSVLGKIDAR